MGYGQNPVCGLCSTRVDSIDFVMIYSSVFVDGIREGATSASEWRFSCGCTVPDCFMGEQVAGVGWEEGMGAELTDSGWIRGKRITLNGRPILEFASHERDEHEEA